MSGIGPFGLLCRIHIIGMAFDGTRTGVVARGEELLAVVEGGVLALHRLLEVGVGRGKSLRCGGRGMYGAG